MQNGPSSNGDKNLGLFEEQAQRLTRGFQQLEELQRAGNRKDVESRAKTLKTEVKALMIFCLLAKVQRKDGRALDFERTVRQEKILDRTSPTRVREDKLDKFLLELDLLQMP